MYTEVTPANVQDNNPIVLQLKDYTKLVRNLLSEARERE